MRRNLVVDARRRFASVGRLACDKRRLRRVDGACYILARSPPYLVERVSRRRALRKPIAWLAWLAMALLIVAPLVSRILPTAPAAMAQAMGMGHPHAGANTGHPPRHDGTRDPTDCCGYCVLFGRQSLLAAHTILYLLPAAPLVAVATVYRIPSLEPPARLWARPRGPPAST